MTKKKDQTSQVVKTLSDFVKSEVKSELESEIGSDSGDLISDITEEDQEQIENILASFPSSQGFYGKLYRKSPTGKFEFYYNLENLEQITDPELEIANLIRERNWPSGDYVLRIMKHGTPGIKKTISWSISNAEPRGDNYSNNNDNNKTGLDQIKDAISVVRELTPPSAAPNPIEDPSSMAEILSNTLKTGINTAKDFTQEKESTSNIMKDMLSSLKDLGVFEKKDSGLNLGVILQSLGPLMIKVVDTFTKKKEEDPLQTIIKLKEAGVIRLANEESDPINSISKLTEIMTAIQALSGVSSGQQSLGVEALRILGPSIPKMVGNITDTINKVTQSKLGPIPNPVLPVHPEIENKNLPKPEESTMSIINNLVIAIHNNDIKYYPDLETVINTYLGTHIIPGLLNNSILLEDFVNQVVAAIPQLDREKALSYLKGFIKSKKETHTDIIAHCEKCDAIYDYETKEEFQTDNKICEVCGSGIILAVIPEPENIVSSDNHKE